MGESLGFAHFLEHADPVAWVVLALLLGMSIASWYWIAAKGLHWLRLQRRSRSFLAGLSPTQGFDALSQRARTTSTDDPYARLFREGFDAVERHRRCTLCGEIDAGTPQAFLARSLKRSIVHELIPLDAGQTLLATVASTAPFVGLFGTVWGIYHALLAIGDAGAAGLQEVAGPVGEALIMTGIGLAVAIPASIGYNAFARARRNLRGGLESFAHDLLELLETGSPPSRWVHAAPRDAAKRTPEPTTPRAFEPERAAEAPGGR